MFLLLKVMMFLDFTVSCSVWFGSVDHLKSHRTDVNQSVHFDQFKLSALVHVVPHVRPADQQKLLL